MKEPPNKPNTVLDPPSETAELREVIIGRDKPIELAFQEIVESIAGKCSWEIKGDVLYCHHPRGTGSILISFLHEQLKAGIFQSFAESYAINAKK